MQNPHLTQEEFYNSANLKQEHSHQEICITKAQFKKETNSRKNAKPSLLIQHMNQSEATGFTLGEAMIVLAIIGILSSVALPSFLRQFQKSKLSEAAATLAQFQQKLANYVDEYKAIPENWKDLSDYSLIMTSTGPASTMSFGSSEWIDLPGRNYKVTAIKNGTDLYTFHAIPTHPETKKDGYNIMACIDLENGATDLKKGPIARDDEDQDSSVNTTDLICRACMKNNNCT